MKGSLHQHLYFLKRIHSSKVVCLLYDTGTEERKSHELYTKPSGFDFNYALLLAVLSEVFVHMSLYKVKAKSFEG